MVTIVSVEPDSPLIEEGRALFAAYRQFLETIESTHCFNFARYLEEIAELPLPYSSAGGELLLARVDGQAIGCIAYRTTQTEGTCEVKRLFVRPEFRGRGFARMLIAEALRRAGERGFTRAILDTDVVSMRSAYATYVSFGFREYAPGGGPHPASLRFLERMLPAGA